ncbi:T9SS type A sorting domain-containing protein [Crocinitomix algicola]|uniref:T9SS type A sorting domain-containing protein n=1 Tax=Crocinitomix algicola TaxID=1740263 RepID=UPI00082A0762|nr:T9SS type A sorting domain-containing protein [Crocinitomix algicola]
MRLIKINQYGVVEWDTIYGFTPSHEFGPKIVNAHDSGVLVASTSFSYPVDDQDGIQDILVWKINEEGEILWQKVIAARMFNSIIATSDGNYILLGVRYTETIDLLITKINDEGVIIWQNIIERPWDGELISWESATSLTEIDSAVYVGASIGSPEEVGSDALLYKIDLKGDIIWELRVPRHFPANDIKVSSIFKFNDRYYFKDNMFDGELYSLNPTTGDFKNINDSIQIELIDQVVDNSCDDSDVITGLMEITEQKFNFRKFNRLDSAAYYETTFDAPEGGFKKIIKSRDGGYIVLSQSWSGGTMVVSKTDCMGNVAFWTEECNPKIPENATIFLYPNPVKNVLTVESSFDFSEVSIINSLGQRTVYQNDCKCNRKILDVSNLSAGVYTISITNDTEMNVIKFLKLQ